MAALSLVMVGYSVATARTMIAAARDRLKLDHEARKALHFVSEFEISGRGWFWETNSQGTLSYVSQQLADDFKCAPEALLGRQFTNLLSVDNQSGDVLREERTLGFHLSARFPFSDVVVRAASDEDVHWSLSGNPIFDQRGRFLGFRGIGTDLTEQRRSEQEISRLARFDSLTGLPNRALMRQTLDEALRNATRRQKGCTLVHHRSRPLQERQRYAWPPDRRRAAAARRAAADQRDGRPWPGRAPRRRRIYRGASGRGRNRAARKPRANADRTGFATLPDRGPSRHDRRLGRHRDWRSGPRLRRLDGSQCRPRLVRRQGRRARPALLLRSVDAQRGVGPPSARKRPAPGARPRRIVGRVPADRSRRRRGGFGLRGAGALEPPQARRDRAGQVHSARRGMRDDRQDRPVRAPDRARRSGALARPGADRGQSVADPVQRSVDHRDRRRPRWPRPRSAPSGSSWKSPKACSLPTATRPTLPSRA